MNYARSPLREGVRPSSVGTSVQTSNQTTGKKTADRSEWSEELRARFLGIGMVAVAAACLLFGITRLILQLQTGLRTPWAFNFSGVALIAALYYWYQRKPEARSELAVHSTAGIASVLLVIPVAYGMPSTVWWLCLVGFAMTLMSRRREAALWAISTVILVAFAPMLGALVQVSDAAGEQVIEANLARTAFAMILFGIAYAFRRELEKRASSLTALTADLQIASTTKDRFLAHMSHELRTPLHGLLGMAEHALNEPLDGAQRRRIEAIRDSGTTLLRLLNDVLDFGRANADTLVLDAQAFALHDTIADVLPPFVAQARQRGLRCSASAASGMRRWRVGDAARIRQIVLNLMSNGLKFTREGFIEVHLAPWPEHADGVLLRVTDSGIGIPAELGDQLGEAFVQGETGHARAHGGAGLGLAMVHELAQRMQGKAELAVSAAGGTVASVYLRLPFSEADPDSGTTDLLEVRRQPAARPTASSRRSRTQRILVCEDDPLGQVLLAATLTLLGHDYVLANDGAEGIELVYRDQFDLVLTDIEMPKLDGYGFLQKLREYEAEQTRRPIAVVAVTAHAEPRDRARFLEAGFDEYLAKPFSIDELEQLLGRLAARDRDQAEAEAG